MGAAVRSGPPTLSPVGRPLQDRAVSSLSTSRRVPGPRILVPVVMVVATVATLALVAGSCGSDDPTKDAAAESTTTAHGSGHGDSGSSDGTQAYGSHGMAPEVVTPAELAELGPGPAVGQTFAGSFGLNVCGRFLDPPATASSAATGVSTDGSGRFTVAPPDDSTAGENATIDELLDLIGVQLSTGSVTFPATTEPAQIQVATASLGIAGATFGDDFECGDVATKVQLWVYSADAVATGEDVRAVEVDPQDTPIAQDGMAFVVTVTPESSLPTLPPSALQD